MPLLEAIEQRASTQGVTVDTRIIRGRTYRDALRRMLDSEDRRPRDRLGHLERPQGPERRDLEWMLEKVPAEVLILRPDPEDHRKLTAEGVEGHF